MSFLGLALKALFPLVIILQMIPLLIWMERKVSALIQDRVGPNRANIGGIRLGGLVHSLSDVIKLLFKEDIVPARAHRLFYVLAPGISLVIACVTYAVIPFAAPLDDSAGGWTFQAADLSVGILYILALSSLGVFGIMLGGWASNNKFSALGGLRSSSQMISYEISMGLALLSVIILSGSLEIGDIVSQQSELVWQWNFVKQPLAALIFMTTMFAETNRAPFDLAEGESEIIGYHVEYSSMKFAMFFMAEYAHMVVASALIVSIFFGGWQVPFLSTQLLRNYANQGLSLVLLFHAATFLILGIRFLLRYPKKPFGDVRDREPLFLGSLLVLAGLGVFGIFLSVGSNSLSPLGSQIFAAVCQIAIFLFKILFFCFVFIWVRWTVPRFRYDQLMTLGWKKLLPLALANLIVTALVLYWKDGV